MKGLLLAFVIFSSFLMNKNFLLRASAAVVLGAGLLTACETPNIGPKAGKNCRPSRATDSTTTTTTGGS
ncbi:hypothetical protein GCM10011378_06970 [Hymenobacter glacieicola]|uniref:Uncharacterized protein n=2 Tax=Hymenobacter glacieicola TaxID=1562124 RepID=A0ABQ1WJF3_9BACT|nr:hypothetical protein GCM10011378_06970 [Hymenobacter glacieicola]